MRRWRSKVGYGLLGVAIFEAVARLAPDFIARHVHQPYLLRREPASHEAYGAAAAGLEWEWRTNGRGARGSLYRGQKIQLGFFGTSTTACSLLTQKDSWPERIAASFDGVHVDNFGLDGVGSDEVKTVMNHLADRGRRYDAVVVMTRPSFPGELKRDADARAFRFWSRWADTGGGLRFVELFRRQLPAFRAVGGGFTEWLGWFRIGVAAAAGEGFHPRDPKNRQRIARGDLRFADDPEDFRLRSWEPDYIRGTTRQLLNAALRLSDRVFFLSEAVAYDELQTEGVAERWYLLNPIRNKPGYYRSMRSQAFLRRARIQEMMKAARRLPVRVLDLDTHMRVLLRSRNDLFFDHAHTTATGAAEIARFVSEHLKSELGLVPASLLTSH